MAQNPAHPVRYTVEFTRVVDGDTIRVVWHGEHVSVRLLGIDAPERNQAGALQSTEYLRGLLAGADTVELEFDSTLPKRDSFGRLLGYIWHSGMLLNLEMLRKGHAGLYKNGGHGKYGDLFRNAVRLRPQREALRSERQFP